MSKLSTKKVLPKKRGRPATGKDPMMALRMPPAFKARIDSWAEAQKDKLSRSEAIRRLVELGLAADAKRPQKSK